MTMTPTLNDKTLPLRVSLDAVGATKTIGAAIRIVGLRSSDLESYTATQGFTPLPANLDEHYYNIKTSETFLTENQSPNNTGNMVVVLFKDAHWAINPELASDGSIQNVFYNTVDRNVPSNKAYVTPKEAVYTFVFKEASKAQSMLKENLYDVFIVEPYNGGYWEVHTVQNGFKTAQVITPLKSVSASGKTYEQAYGSNMPWAIMVPGSFKYPIEWQVIGKKTGGALSGAYKQAGHSFGEWAENSSTATDWYNYPTASLVFE
jgi:LruC domain-containing protein